MARIQLTDKFVDAFVKLAEGNPGAMTVMAEIAKRPEIDPDAMLGPLASILDMDTLELYGPNIWLLYKDVCGESVERTVAVLRGWQLGYCSREQIHAALRKPSELDVQAIYDLVKKRLPSFDPEGKGAVSPA